MSTLLALLRIENRADAQPFKCTNCELRQYHFIHNLNSGGSPGCKCQGKQKAEKIFAEKFAKRFNEVGRSLYSQPAIFVDGKKRSFDFVLLPDDEVCSRDNLLFDKNAPYVFIEILDINHRYKKRVDKDIEVFGQVIKDYPNAKVIYIDSFTGTDQQIKEVLSSINNVDRRRISRLFFGKEQYKLLCSCLKEEYRKFKKTQI